MRAIALAPLLLLSAAAPPPGPEVVALEVDGVVGPVTARFLARELGRAAGAEAIVIELDTPGGLESSMREMVEAMAGAPAPVVVHVAPGGARAASAGTFLVLASDVAAMAPGTNLGAAHPVSIGGDEERSARADKALEDAAALARSLAERRGRNAAWAERAVRESASLSADEALAEGVIELVVPDREALLAALDGRRVGEDTLRTAGARVVERRMGPLEQLLQAVTDPNVAYLLLLVGLVGIGVELLSPGLFFPGIGGAIALVLAFLAFGSLPVSAAGVLLLVLAAALLVAELNVPGTGVLGFGGLVAFVVGSLVLYQPGGDAPLAPDVRVDPWLVATAGAALLAFFLFVLRAVVRARASPVRFGPQALVGRTGVASSELRPEGTVRVDTETWSARADEPIRAGEAVRVTGVEGVTLRVGKQPPEDRHA